MVAVEDDLVRAVLGRDVESIMGWFPVGRIRFDPIYQRRPPSKQAIAALARAWDADRAGVIYLSLRDDQVFCIDGQTRVRALRLAEGDIALILARFYDGLGQQDEARLFDAYNRLRRQPRALDTFKARLAYGEPGALAIQRAVSAIDFTIESDHGNMPRRIASVTALDDAYQQLGEQRLTAMLSVMVQGLGAEEPHALSSIAIKGMTMFMARYDGLYDQQRLVATLRRQGWRSLMQSARALSSLISLPSPTCWGQGLQAVYNRGLRRDPLPVWTERAARLTAAHA